MTSLPFVISVKTQLWKPSENPDNQTVRRPTLVSKFSCENADVERERKRKVLLFLNTKTKFLRLVLHFPCVLITLLKYNNKPLRHATYFAPVGRTTFNWVMTGKRNLDMFD